MDAKTLESEIADHLGLALHSPRSRDIHAAVRRQAVGVEPTLVEVRAALQRMKLRGEVRTAGHCCNPYGERAADLAEVRRLERHTRDVTGLADFVIGRVLEVLANDPDTGLEG